MFVWCVCVSVCVCVCVCVCGQVFPNDDGTVAFVHAILDAMCCVSACSICALFHNMLTIMMLHSADATLTCLVFSVERDNDFVRPYYFEEKQTHTVDSMCVIAIVRAKRLAQTHQKLNDPT